MLDLSQQALSGFQKLGDKSFQSAALRLVGRAYIDQGDLTNGTAALLEALSLARQLGNKFQIALILWRSFAEAALSAGKTARAVTLISAAIYIFQSIGAWMDDCIELCDGYKVSSSELYDSFRRWTEKAGEFCPSQKRFSQKLEDRGITNTAIHQVAVSSA